MKHAWVLDVRGDDLTRVCSTRQCAESVARAVIRRIHGTTRALQTIKQPEQTVWSWGHVPVATARRAVRED